MALLDIMVEVALVGLCPPQHYDGHGRLAPEPSGGPRFIMGPAFILLHQAPARQARQQEQSEGRPGQHGSTTYATRNPNNA